MAAPSNKLYGKMWDSFVLPQENGSSKRFYFKANRKTLGFFKNGKAIFKIPLRLADRHVFRWRSLGILNVFNILNLKQVWKTLKN